MKKYRLFRGISGCNAKILLLCGIENRAPQCVFPTRRQFSHREDCGEREDEKPLLKDEALFRSGV